ncbi:MAG: helix-turn-helix domain-containing protein [Oligosphaeraceae bacterium]
MKTETFRTVARLVAEDPLTERQIRELTGADIDDIIPIERVAEMFGISKQAVRRLRDLKHLRINGRRVYYRLVDVRRYRDERCW